MMSADREGAPGIGISEREFVVLLGMLQALQALAIDAMLPALGVMARDLGATGTNDRQLIIGIFLIFAGIGSLIPGALSDRFGRKRVLLAFVGGYVLCNLGCALVQTTTALLVMRGMTGLAAAALAVLPLAIIRDRFEGDRMARFQSSMAMIFLIVPMVAPSLGQAIMHLAGWRWIFGFMALYGAAVLAWAWLRLPETLHPEYRQPVMPRAIATNMRLALSNRASIGYVLGAAVMSGGNFGYLNCAQQLVGEHLGAGDAFPLVFTFIALMMTAASFTNSRIVERFGARRVSHTALFGYIVTALVQVWLASRPHQSLWQFAPLIGLNLCLMGFIGANFGSIALQPFAQIAGAAASAHSTLRLTIGATLGALIGQSYDGTGRPLAAALVGCGFSGLALVLFSEKGRLFRRLNPPAKKGGMS